MSDALLIQEGLQNNSALVSLVFSNVFRESYQKDQRLQEGTGIHQILANIDYIIYLKRTQNCVICFEESVGLEPEVHSTEYRYMVYVSSINCKTKMSNNKTNFII
jgi:hypothetical protein